MTVSRPPVAAQVAGAVAPTYNAGLVSGYVGWSAQTDRTVYTVLGGLAYKGAWATTTAYAVGDVVSYNGDTYAALSAVPATNTSVPVVGEVWRAASNKRGLAQVLDAINPVPQFYQ